MKRLLAVALVALAVLMAPLPLLAGDEQAATPPPSIPRGGWTPPVTPAASVDEQRVAELIDRAVDRAVARRLAAQSPGPVGGWTPPAASPQGVVAAPPRSVPRIVPAGPARRVAYVPAYSEDRQYVQVRVPAPPHRRAIAALGERMVRCGQDRTRLMRVVPATVAVCGEPSAPVLPSGQQ